MSERSTRGRYGLAVRIEPTTNASTIRFARSRNRLEMSEYKKNTALIHPLISACVAVGRNETHLVSSRRRVHKWVHNRLLTRRGSLATS